MFPPIVNLLILFGGRGKDDPIPMLTADGEEASSESVKHSQP